MKFQQWVIRSSVATVLSLGCLTSVMAERPLMPSNVLPAYKNECASCHMAYPPAMLSKPSWQRIMGSLDKH